MKHPLILSTIITSIFISGCSLKEVPPQKKEHITMKVNIKDNYTELEQKLINISNKIQTKQNEYTEIMMDMKNRHQTYKNQKIPKRLSKRVSFEFEGPALVLLKNIADESGYRFISNSDNPHNIYDSKHIYRNFQDTMLIDIITDIESRIEGSVVIDESEETISVIDR